MLQQRCGQMNRYMLGHATAAIQMTRGGREGINALLDSSHSQCLSNQLHIFIRRNVPFEILAFLVKTGWADFADKVYKAVRYGHRLLAAYMIKAYSSYNFNDLHSETLTNNTQPLKVKPCHSVLVTYNHNLLTAVKLLNAALTF
ncbi:unnamed protein product [Gongylonema pulchrum]|uniref:ANK_REP_REGION domain-containing protein n=1 Tax=Gongylonema pulchrum TaxID=637853 RepID=A0A183DS12_9BILA|nr:unnamed protein product [Gongylonema pulchrum]